MTNKVNFGRKLRGITIGNLRIGPATRSMVRERIGKEAALGKAAEFGCGTGFDTLALAAKGDCVAATDLPASLRWRLSR